MRCALGRTRFSLLLCLVRSIQQKTRRSKRFASSARQCRLTDSNGMNVDILQDRCKAATEQALRIRQLMPVTEPRSPRHRLVRCSIALAMEHHTSIITLVSVGNYSTAAALLRPLMEAGACGFWLTYACPPERLEILLQGRDETPTLPKMISHLARIPGLYGVRKLAEMLPKEGRYLDSYTHGGMAQLAQRDWKTPFDLPRNLHTLMVSDMFAVAGAAIATAIYEAEDLFDYLGVRRDQIGDEVSARTGKHKIKDPWIPLPAPTLL